MSKLLYRFTYRSKPIKEVLLEREFGGDYFKQYNEVERLMIADDWLKVEIFRPL